MVLRKFKIENCKNPGLTAPGLTVAVCNLNQFFSKKTTSVRPGAVRPVTVNNIGQTRGGQTVNKIFIRLCNLKNGCILIQNTTIMRYIFSTMLVIAGLLLAFTQKEPFTVSGTVMDDQGNPLVNASISIKGTTKSTVTDALGFFSIEVPGPKSVLLIQYVGYESQEIKLNAAKKLQIKLKCKR